MSIYRVFLPKNLADKLQLQKISIQGDAKSLNIIMNSRVVIIVLVNFMLLISMYLLYQLITRDESENDDSSRKRFIFLLAIHFFLFFSMFIFASLTSVYDVMLWMFFNLLTIAGCIFVCEQIVQAIWRDSSYNYNHFSYDNEIIQVNYLNIYFLTYMYALIGLFLNSLFLIATQGFLCYQQIQIDFGLQLCLRIVNLEHQQNGECSICLLELEDGKKCVEIKSCGHFFHEECLLDWIRSHNTCPLDRKNIFNVQENNRVQDIFGE